MVTLKKSLSIKLLKAVFTIYFSITLLITALHVYIEYQDTKSTIKQELILLEKTFKPVMSTALWEFNTAQQQSILEGIYNVPYVSAVSMKKKEGQKNYFLGSEEKEFFHSFKIFNTFEGEEVLLSELTIYSDKSKILQRVKTGFLLIVLNAFIKSILLWLLFLWAFKKYLSTPLEKFVKNVQEINLNQIENQKIDLHVDDNELRVIEDSFNTMLDKIKTQKDRIVNIDREYSLKLESDIQTRTCELEDVNLKLKHYANTDSLTKIKNRRMFLELANQYHALSYINNQSMSLMMLDLDRFKAINDTYGHKYGDEVLKAFTRLGRWVLRKADIFGRVGGEEFAIILRDTSKNDALAIATRIVEESAKNIVLCNDKSIKYTVSIGLSELKLSDENFDNLMQRADSKLYEAKREGRNRVVS